MTEIDKVKQLLLNFKLPCYNEIPNVGLYLEQTSKYISECLSPLCENAITGSMISNYVKKGLISNPVKKQYNRDQIAYLMFIAMAKTVLSIEDIKLMIEIQKDSYETQLAYTYLKEEFENVLQYVFGIKKEMEVLGKHNNDAKIMLRNVIITIAHKVYLDSYFSNYRKERNG
ncbi:MAG: DUF1836 domain-containing protein [Clostridia bacterium]